MWTQLVLEKIELVLDFGTLLFALDERLDDLPEYDVVDYADDADERDEKGEGEYRPSGKVSLGEREAVVVEEECDAVARRTVDEEEDDFAEEQCYAYGEGIANKIKYIAPVEYATRHEVLLVQ